MKYTQELLKSMSDFELNLIVCENFIPVIVEESQREDLSAIMVNDIVNMYPLDFCRSWGDCGSLIDELISVTGSTIEFDDDIFIFYHRRNKTVVKCKNTKRAAVIVYILVKQSNG